MLYYYLFFCHTYAYLFFFLMIRRPPRSTLDRSSAASDVYKRQVDASVPEAETEVGVEEDPTPLPPFHPGPPELDVAVSYTHLRAHETVLDLVCRLLLEKKNNNSLNTTYQ